MRKHLLKAVLLLPCLLASAASLAYDSARVSTEHVTVTLVGEPSKVEPGQTLWIGLRFDIIPHWHIYWRNPGASGTAPVIRWMLPDGWQTGELHWPVPKRIRVGPLTNYGYEDRVTLLVPVQVPPGPLPAGPQIITAEAEWLVCRIECIPESGRITLELDNAGSGSSMTGEMSELFKATRAQWPEATPLSGDYLLEGDTLAISVAMTGTLPHTPGYVWFAAVEWGPVDASGTQHWEQTASGFTLRVPAGDLPPAANSPLEGLLVVESEQNGVTTRSGHPVFEARSVAYLVADWTRRDPAITRQLERYGRSGVPLYLLYSAGAAPPVVLPQLLTEDIIAEAIHQL